LVHEMQGPRYPMMKRRRVGGCETHAPIEPSSQ
jgi:hypothetical protein